MAINFPNSPVGGTTYSYLGVTYVFKNTGGGTGFWQITGPGSYGLASSAEINEGIEAVKYISPASLAGSDYIKDLIEVAELPKASTAEIDAGTVFSKYVGPANLAGSKYVRESNSTFDTRLNFNGLTKLRTTSAGLSVTGSISATGAVSSSSVSTGAITATGAMSSSSISTGLMSSTSVSTGAITATGTMSSASVSTGAITATGTLASGNITVTGTVVASGNITAFSDSRVKEDVELIDNALDKVKQVRGVTFTRNDVEDTETRHAGVIAQELQAVLPEAVYPTQSGMLSVDYGNTIGLLVEAIKELTAKVEALEGGSE
jgi:hypothetical protein